MSIDLDSIDEESRRAQFGTLFQQVEIPPDQRAVDRIQSIVGQLNASVSASSPSLQGRVSAEKPIKELLKESDLEHLPVIQKAIQNNPEGDTNYLILVQNIVGKILAQLSRIADKDRDQIEDMKTKYNKAYALSSELTREYGWSGLKFSGLSVACMALQFLSPHQTDRDIIAFISKEVCPNIGQMFGSNIQSEIKKADALSQLIMQEYSAKTGKGSSEANNKQEIIQILEKVLASLKEASRAG